jgi:uncharacterized protein YraI
MRDVRWVRRLLPTAEKGNAPMKLQARLVAAMLLASPAMAVAAPGMITSSVNLRAGPSVEFPVVNRLARGAPVEVYGCIRQALWCDVSWGRERGWVAAQYLDYFYDGRYVDLPSYVDVVDVPVASFSLTSYWSSFYFGRPWYRRHAWWTRHWNAQNRVATQAPLAAPAQAGNGMTPAGSKPPAGTAMTPAGTATPPAGTAMGNAAPATMNRQATGAPAMRASDGGRMSPAPGGQDRFSGMRSSMTSRAAGTATAMRGGVPMAAHAQFGGMGGLPRAAIGGAPQAGGAAHNGGGRDNGGGRRRH